MTAPTTARLVRFHQPEKSVPFLTGADDTRVAAVFGLDAAAYRALLADFEREARAAAEALLDDADVAAAVARLPLAAGAHVVALGESTTADRLSWFEIARHALDLHRPGHGIRFTNLAVSGSTTTQGLSRAPALGYQRPDLVLCMFGANDVQRLGRDGPRLVSQGETERNLAALRAFAGPVPWTWLTPAAVDEARVAAYPHFQRAGLWWANADVDAVADHLLDRPEPVVDTRRTGPGVHLDDGVHLTVDGQRDIAAAVFREWS
ncbi:SGNH/GDSL hydrolase family protein [Saccharothrix obliqua]|uniref:SGNH/GDSL hydrolase family protein n=1 Tax=Saccharothrix obliqua TaxID=2861747 RepID=UPI001C5DC15C|nr:SGNH/GDSL hydrolase family protein [Saccharothrix obliqua]MBW4718066.1 SGNH/GDSL hydrolase family protein [Saccharothrix obliqua]